MADGYLVERTSTDGLAGAAAKAAWRDHVRRNHGELDYAFARVDDFRGSTVVQRAGDYQLVEFWSDPIAYERTRSHVRRDDDQTIRIVVPQRGVVDIGAADGTARIGPGSAAAMSMTAHFTLRHERTTRAWILSLPSAAWPRSLTRGKPQLLDLQAGLGAISRTLISELARQRAELSAADFVDASGHAAQLLATCAGDPLPGADRLARTARDYVRLHAGDVTLTPASLASRLGWSLRQVQSALQADGTTASELLRSIRLSNAWAALTSRSTEAVSISEIAFAQGFGSVSGFNAAFRQEFGMSPREARRGRTSHVTASAD